jgi:hypothetical protein
MKTLWKEGYPGRKDSDYEAIKEEIAQRLLKELYKQSANK